MAISEIPAQTKEQSEISIINSIANTDVSISNMIYMEIEKIKLATGTSTDNTNTNLISDTVKDLLSMNSSVKNLLDSISMIEKVLNSKLSSAVNNS